jgi:hypothetical protein
VAGFDAGKARVDVRCRSLGHLVAPFRICGLVAQHRQHVLERRQPAIGDGRLELLGPLVGDALLSAAGFCSSLRERQGLPSIGVLKQNGNANAKRYATGSTAGARGCN